MDPPTEGIPRGVKIGAAALVLGAVAFVALSLRRPEVPEYEPTPVSRIWGPGPRVLTVDAADAEDWRYVDLEEGRVVEAPGPRGWDLAFRRFEVRVNGGPGFRGGAGALDLGPVPFDDAVGALPDTGYVGMSVRGRDTTHAALDDWYAYSFTTHVLRPRDRIYAIRTAEGTPVALRFLSYYCTGAQPGCVTVRYAFPRVGGPPEADPPAPTP